MKAKVLSVYDEGAVERTPLIGARGLSMLVEVDDELTLFDTGMRGNYLMHNMENLEIDPNAIRRVVLSHAHRTHTGGLPAFLEKRKEKVDVLMPPGCGEATEKRFGLFTASAMPKMSPDVSSKMNTVTVNEWTKLSDRLFVTAPLGGELFLVLMTKNGPVMMCGCCHSGIAEAVSHVKEASGKKVAAVIGGTHLAGMKRKEIHAIAETLKDSGPPMLHLNHCTGVAQKTYLREKLGLIGVKEFYAGTEIRFEV